MHAATGYLALDVVGGCFFKVKAATVRSVRPAKKRHQVEICYRLGSKHGRSKGGKTMLETVVVKGDAAKLRKKLAAILDANW